MNKYFDIKRFGKYVTYDLVNSWGRYGMSAIIIGLFPLIIFVFQKFFSLVFGEPGNPFPDTMKVVSLVCVLSLLIVVIPSKLYGFVTEKKAGSSWLMIPASALEKSLWMCIMLCVVIPLAVGLVFTASDLLLSLVFPGMYGSSIVVNGLSGLHEMTSSIVESEYIDVTFFGYSSAFLNLWAPILVFTLGALVFKTGKPAKTMLSIIIFMSVFTSLMYMIISNIDMDVILDDMTIEKGQFILNLVANVGYLITFSVLLGGIYYRVKTLKH